VSELLRLTVYVMLLSPLVAFLVIALMSRRVGASGAEAVSIVMGAMSLLMALLLWYQVIILETPDGYATIYRWVDYEPSRIVMGIWVDHVSACTALIVTCIAWLVQIYSIGYMHEDVGYARYCALLSLFTGSMVVLVMSSNMLEMFFAWEIMSVVSYGLIGYWYEKKSATDAAFIAIIINRIGDCALLMGIILWRLWGGSWDVADILALSLHSPILQGLRADIVVGLMMVGVMSKSAQIPLHIWLPAAMAGPTPVSALLHAATMVAAGVFWAVRYSQIFILSPSLGGILMTIGAVGSLYTAARACMEDNLKYIMAYSTLSQLGIMTVAIGSGAYTLALFHFYTHAFTKALLFLVIGRISLKLDHQLSLSAMGGLLWRMPLMAFIMLCAGCSLVGIPPFSGFWSKEGIIFTLLAHKTWLSSGCAIMLIGSGGLCALYMLRMWKHIFLGTSPGYVLHQGAYYTLSVPIILLTPASMGIGAYISTRLYDPLYWHIAATKEMLEHSIALQYYMQMFFTSSAYVGPQIVYQGSIIKQYSTWLLHGINTLSFHDMAGILSLCSIVCGGLCAWHLQRIMPYMDYPIRIYRTFFLTRKAVYPLIASELYAFSCRLARMDHAIFYEGVVSHVTGTITVITQRLQQRTQGSIGVYITHVLAAIGISTLAVVMQYYGGSM